MHTNKKVFIFSFSLFILSVLFLLIYNFAFKPKEADTTAEIKTEKVPEITPEKIKTPEEKTQPKINLEAIIPISDEATISPTLANTSDAIKYYSKNTGKIHQVDFFGEKKRTLSEKELSGIQTAIWSPDKNKSIVKTLLADKTTFQYYNHTDLTNTPLKENVDEIAWQNGSNRIFYKYYDTATKKRSLNISDPDGTNWIKLADISFRDVSIAQIPQSGLVSFWNKPDAFFETNFKAIPLVGGEEKLIMKNLFGADYLWNDNGTYALVSHSDIKGGGKIQLSIINSNGGELKNLNLPTLVSKCIWLKDNKTVFCAMAGKIPDLSVMPNDYDQKKFYSSDTFWKIDTITGEKNRLLELDKITAEYDATNLFLDSNEKNLFFINRKNGRLYKLAL